MAGEWKRAVWTYDAVGLGHTNVTIMEAIEDFMLACGWARSAWDTTTDRFFLRSDRYTVLLTNDTAGTAGNVALAENDPNNRITLVGMSGGTASVRATGSITLSALDLFDGDTVTLSDGTNPALTFNFEAGAAAARGRVAFLAQPADGNTVVVNDGVNPAVTFEFDSTSSVVATATLRQVVIGGSIGSTIANFVAAVNDAAVTLAVTANVGASDSATLTNDTAGVAGNVALSRVGSNIFLTGMTGGGGTAGVTVGHVLVPRGATVEDTIVNLVAAINVAASLNVTAKWANRWTFNGDGIWQHCGVEVFNDTANSRIILRAFLQKASGTGNYRATNVAHEVRVAYSQTAPNNFQFFGGEYGFFGECGRDGQRVNLAHWAITTFETMPELFGTDDERVTWTAQGLCMDLFGNLKFSDDRNMRFVDTPNGHRNFTGNLRPFAVRGTSSFATSVQADDPRAGVGPLDTVLGMFMAGNPAPSYSGVVFTFGLTLTPRDGRYRISPLLIRQYVYDYAPVAVYTGSASNNVAASGSSDAIYCFDVRRWRKMPKFAVTDASLIPFNNVTDQATGLTYYISQVQDGGRQANLCIEWTTDVVSIPATPT